MVYMKLNILVIFCISAIFCISVIFCILCILCIFNIFPIFGAENNFLAGGPRFSWVWCYTPCTRKQVLCCAKLFKVLTSKPVSFAYYTILDILCTIVYILHILHILHIWGTKWFRMVMQANSANMLSCLSFQTRLLDFSTNTIIQHMPRCSCLQSHSTGVELMFMEASFGIRYPISVLHTYYAYGAYLNWILDRTGLFWTLCAFICPTPMQGILSFTLPSW